MKPALNPRLFRILSLIISDWSRDNFIAELTSWLEVLSVIRTQRCAVTV
jgi:ribosomal protein S18 acetylase RimI-like enzyme